MTSMRLVLRHAIFLIFVVASFHTICFAGAVPSSPLPSQAPGREWADRPSEECDPAEAARDYWFSDRDPDAVTLEFKTVEEARRYQDPWQRPVYWLVRQYETPEALAYLGGINDLWAVLFEIDRFTCAVTIIQEH